MQLTHLIPVLQIAVGPVILISGVGLLLLSMTNRLGRTIDRAREIVDVLNGEAEDAPHDPRHVAQLEVLWRRAKILRTAITLAAISALLAALLIIVLFLCVLLKFEMALVVVAVFVGCLGSMIASLVFFIRDIDISLKALDLEIRHHKPKFSKQLKASEATHGPNFSLRNLHHVLGATTTCTKRAEQKNPSREEP